MQRKSLSGNCQRHANAVLKVAVVRESAVGFDRIRIEFNCGMF
jgi:hypothetical protein